MLQVIRTHDVPKNHVFPYVYTPHLVLITMYPRKCKYQYCMYLYLKSFFTVTIMCTWNRLQ